MHLKVESTKPYRYLLVYTTDLRLSVATLVRYYKLRWGFETNMRDTKQELGFDQYQVRSPPGYPTQRPALVCRRQFDPVAGLARV